MLDDRVRDMLIRWEEARQAGREIPLVDLCRDHPQLLGELEENVRKLQAVNARLEEHQLDSQPTNTSTASPSVVLADAPAIPELLGRYQLVEALGRGGNARVWKAYDPDLRRYVAVKFPRGTAAAGQDACELFLNEARKLALLVHPNIVHVYDFGHENGAAFIVTEVIDGSTLGQYARDNQLEVNKCVSIVAAVADALHVAHSQGIIHLDVKSSNIFIDAGGQPHVGDFGIAISPDTDGEDATGVHCTPAYAAPEQVHFDPQQLGPATDVFGLGVVLYQVLTGRLPFGKQGVFVVSGESDHTLQPPSELNPGVSPQLNHVCLTALAMQPENRFTSADEFAQTLRECLRAQSQHGVTTSHPTAEHRRGWWFYGLISVCVVALLLAIWQREWIANALITGHAAKPTTKRSNALEPTLVFQLVGHSIRPRRVVICGVQPLAVSTSTDHSVRVWDLADQRELEQLGHDAGFMYDVAITPSGKYIAGAGNDGMVYLWQWPQTEPLSRLHGHTDQVLCVRFTHDGRQLISGGSDRTVRIWDVATQQLLATLPRLPGRVQDLAISPDDHWLAVACPDVGPATEAPPCKSVWLLPLQGDAKRRELCGHEGYVRSVAFSPDGKYLASGAGGVWRSNGYHPAQDNNIILWDLQTGKPVQHLKTDGDGFTSLLFTPDGTRLISRRIRNRERYANPDEDPMISIWDLPTGQLLEQFAGGEAVTCTSDGHLVYSAMDAVLRAIELPAPSRTGASP